MSAIGASLALNLVVRPLLSSVAGALTAVVLTRLLVDFRWSVLYVGSYLVVGAVGAVGGGALGTLFGLEVLLVQQGWLRSVVPFGQGSTDDFVVLATRVRDVLFLRSYLEPPWSSLWAIVLRWAVGLGFFETLPRELEDLLAAGRGRTVEQAVLELVAERARGVRRWVLVVSLLCAVPVWWLLYSMEAVTRA